MANAISEELKLSAMGRIHAGVPLRQLVEELQIPYPKLLGWKKELQEARTNGMVHSLINVDDVIVESVAERVATDMTVLHPEERELIEANVSDVVDGVKGLNVLDKRLQTTALSAANKLHELTERAEGIKELNGIIDGLCKIQTAFFNRGTQVNIQNNLSSEGAGFKKFLRD